MLLIFQFNINQFKLLLSMEYESRSQYDYLFKIGIIGDTAVGKSSLCLQFVQNDTRANYQPTSHIQYGAKVLDIDNLKIKLELWDIGNKVFQNYNYYTECHNFLGILLVYSITSRESFRAAENWLKNSKEFCHEFTKILIVGNKVDQGEMRTVSRLQGEALAANYGTGFCQVCSKQANLIEQIFRVLSQSILKQVRQQFIAYDYKKFGIKLASNGIFSLMQEKRHFKRKNNCC